MRLVEVEAVVRMPYPDPEDLVQGTGHCQRECLVQSSDYARADGEVGTRDNEVIDPSAKEERNRRQRRKVCKLSGGFIRAGSSSRVTP